MIGPFLAAWKAKHPVGASPAGQQILAVFATTNHRGHSGLRAKDICHALGTAGTRPCASSSPSPAFTPCTRATSVPCY